MSNSPRLLLLAPELDDDEAGRNLAAWVRELLDREAATVEVLAWSGGPLAAELARRVPVHVLADAQPAGVVERALLKGRLRRPGYALRRRRLGLAPWLRHAPDAVVLTSPRAAPLLRFLPPRPAPRTSVLVTGDEFSGADPGFLQPADLRLLLDRVERFHVDPASPAPDHLAEAVGLPRERIVVDPAPLVVGRPDGPDAPAREAWRDRLGIAPEDVVVVGEGPRTWDGGADLYLRVAWLVTQAHPGPFSFLWIGPAPDEMEAAQLDHDRRHMGLDPTVRFLGPEAAEAAWLGRVVVVTSRATEERLYQPAGERSQPFVAFRNRPVDHFVAAGAGRAVDFLDLDAMARVTAELGLDPEAAAREGKAVGDQYGRWHVGEERATRALDQILAP